MNCMYCGKLAVNDTLAQGAEAVKEARCINGGQHIYAPTGTGYRTWTGDNTADPCPHDAPFYAEYFCTICNCRKYEMADPPTDSRPVGTAHMHYGHC